MKRPIPLTLFTAALLVLFAAAALAPHPASAQVLASQGNTELKWERLEFRNTSAASTAQNLNWAAASATGFADSTVFRRGATTRTLCDTTKAYRVERWALPPSLPYRTAAAFDSLDTTPWLVIRVRQDSSATSSPVFSGTTGIDSIFVAAEYSLDGVQWFAVSGSPTRAFLAVTIASGQDGTQPPAITTAEQSPGADNARVVLGCVPGLDAGGAYILNKTLCTCGGWVRFLVGVLDGSGQFVAEAATWQETRSLGLIR